MSLPTIHMTLQRIRFSRPSPVIIGPGESFPQHPTRNRGIARTASKQVGTKAPPTNFHSPGHAGGETRALHIRCIKLLGLARYHHTHGALSWAIIVTGGFQLIYSTTGPVNLLAELFVSRWG